jgi:hypothetical protein
MASNQIFILFFSFYSLTHRTITRKEQQAYSLICTLSHPMSSSNWFWIKSFSHNIVYWQASIWKYVLSYASLNEEKTQDRHPNFYHRQDTLKTTIVSKYLDLYRERKTCLSISKNEFDLSVNRNIYIYGKNISKVYRKLILFIDCQILLYIWPVLINR